MLRIIATVLVTSVLTAGICYFTLPRQLNPDVKEASAAAAKALVDPVKSLPTAAKAGIDAPTTDLSAADEWLRQRLDAAGFRTGNKAYNEGRLEGMMAARLESNESAAICKLKEFSSAQAQCQAAGVIDTNNNGVGEYGFLSELAGEPVRSNEAGGVGKTIVRPALLSNSFANVKSLPGVPGGTVTRSGYCFQMFLPDKNGAAVSEALKGGGTGICIDAKKAEVLWCCYAWPSAHGVSGRRTFFINQTGDVLSTNAEVVTYSGDKQPITPTAAFLSTASGLMDCAVAANAVGKDGNRWIVVD